MQYFKFQSVYLAPSIKLQKRILPISSFRQFQKCCSTTESSSTTSSTKNFSVTTTTILSKHLKKDNNFLFFNQKNKFSSRKYNNNFNYNSNMVNRNVLNSKNTEAYPGRPSNIYKRPKIKEKKEIKNQIILRSESGAPPAINDNPICRDVIGNRQKISVRPSTTNTSCPPPDDQQCKSPPPPPNNTKLYLWFILFGAAGGIGLAWHHYNEKKKDTIILDEINSSSNIKKKIPVPATSADIPKKVPYLLIGGGTASFSAFRAIKSYDPKAKVMVISSEYEMPYMRPPLSKEMWFSGDTSAVDNLKFKQWNGVERSLYYEPDDFYVDPMKLMDEPNGGVAIVKGYEVKRIDVVNRKAILTDDTEIQYDECLLATGSVPKTLEVFSAASKQIKQKITVYKTIEDFERLKRIVLNKKSIAIVGGGFLGSELACAMIKYGTSEASAGTVTNSSSNKNKLKVYQIFHEDGNMGKVLPKYLSEWTSERIREEGVCVIPKVQIKSVELFNNDKQVRLTLINGEIVIVDHIVVAVGSEANVQLAKESGLEIDHRLGGYVVNAELEARRHLFVAGDAACFYDPKFGRRRIEHHDHAVVSGRLAGENMVGLKKPYKHQSMFWSDLGPKVGYEAIGLVDSSFETVGVFAARTNNDTPLASSGENLKKQIDNSTSNSSSSSSSSSGNSSSGSADGGTEASVTGKTSDSITVAVAGTDTSIENSTKIGTDENKSNVDLEREPTNKDDFGKGIIFYLRDNEVVGIVLWNVFNRINVARKIIGGRYDDLNEVAKLFEIHS